MRANCEREQNKGKDQQINLETYKEEGYDADIAKALDPQT